MRVLFHPNAERGKAATKSSMSPRPVGAQPRAGGSCYEDSRMLQRSRRKRTWPGALPLIYWNRKSGSCFGT